MSDRVVQISVSLLVGLLIGALVGRWTAPSAPPASSDLASGLPVTSNSPSGPSIGDVARLVGQAEKAIESDEGGGLAAVGGIISAASVSDIIDWSRAPEDVSRRIINEMSDDELISTITSMTKLTSEDLTEYSDLRDYANRMVHIAMSGVITDGLEHDFGHESLEVQFSTGASKSTGAREPRVAFDEGTRKIYAVLSNTGTARDQVMVHWYRIDQPENLLFDQYRVSPGDEFSYVWLKSPAGGWSPGEYRVEFFSADEHLAPIASGTYLVVPE